MLMQEVELSELWGNMIDRWVELPTCADQVDVGGPLDIYFLLLFGAPQNSVGNLLTLSLDF